MAETDEYIPLGKEAEKVAEQMRELSRSCKIIEKEIDDLTVDIKTGRTLGIDELSPDEVKELALHLRKYIFYCCRCMD